MSEPEGLLPDVEVIKQFVAKRIAASGKQLIGPSAVNEAELADRIAEIEIQTQINGASFLKLYLDDPELALAQSGWLTKNNEGLLEPVEIEFPQGSGDKWVLCAAEATTAVSSANVVVTFEDKIVFEMREHWGPKVAPPGTQTRAQFIADLFSEAKIPLVCPSLNKVQPVEEETPGELGTTVVSTTIETQQKHEKSNKTRGVGAGAAIVVKGQTPNAEQLRNINTVLTVCNELNAPQAAAVAIIMAALAETVKGFANERNPLEGAEGVFQLIPSTAQSTGLSPLDVAGCARYWLQHGFFGKGGGIALANKNVNPAEIAQDVEGTNKGPSFFAPYQKEAEDILQAGGGLRLGGSTTTAGGESDVSQLTRGTAENPDEDSWECANRLSQQVDWFLFTDGKHAFFEDGPDLARQKPSLYFDVPSNHIVDGHTGVSQYGALLTPSTVSIDNTSFEYRRDHKTRKRSQRRSKAIKPSSPAEVTLNIICPITAYRAGDVFVGQHSGPWDDRWVVVNTTRKCLKNPHTECILEPPVEPLPEPKGTTKGEELSGQFGNTGYTNPLAKAKQLTAERIDQGVDYSMAAGSEILAAGDGEVAGILSNWYAGQPLLYYKLTSGKYAGKYIYVAEQITPQVKQGDKLAAGQTIALYAATGTGIETGWATSTGATVAQAEGGGYTEGARTAAGQSFSTFLESLGAPPGTTENRPLTGTVPAGYP